jgi:hypothetical protein
LYLQVSLFTFILVLCCGCGEGDIDRDVEFLKQTGYKRIYCNKIRYLSDKSEDSIPTYTVYSKATQVDKSLASIVARCFNNGTCRFEVKEKARNFNIVCQEFYDVGRNSLKPLYDEHILLGFNLENTL